MGMMTWVAAFLGRRYLGLNPVTWIALRLTRSPIVAAGAWAVFALIRRSFRNRESQP